MINIKSIASDLYKFFKNLFIFLLVLGLLGAAIFLIRDYVESKDDIEEIDSNQLNVVFSETWSSDNSNVGAYLFNNDNDSKFILLSDGDKNGVYTCYAEKEYTKVIFVDLITDADNLGLNWCNVREQTNEQLIPSDENVFYHQYADIWSDSAVKLFNKTNSAVQVGYVSYTDSIKVACYFDKFGTNAKGYIILNELENERYSVEIPEGYTHLMFIEYSDEASIGTNDNIISQSGEFVIPSDHNNIFISERNIWVNKFE